MDGDEDGDGDGTPDVEKSRENFIASFFN